MFPMCHFPIKAVLYPCFCKYCGKNLRLVGRGALLSTTVCVCAYCPVRIAVSYTHLDVYKRQLLRLEGQLPLFSNILAAPLRQHPHGKPTNWFFLIGVQLKDLHHRRWEMRLQIFLDCGTPFRKCPYRPWTCLLYTSRCV